jgi:multimeric flavodoxin WrbA
MKVLAICGSPRKGNTQIMLEKVLEGAEKRRAKAELVLLRRIPIKQCDGCQMCDAGEECPKAHDAMHELLKKLEEADSIVFGTPTYFDNVTGLIKKFMDRTVPLYYKEKLKKKKAGIVVVGAQKPKEGSQKRAADALKVFCRIHKMRVVGTIIGVADKKKDILNDDKKLNACVELGKKLAARK